MNRNCNLCLEVAGTASASLGGDYVELVSAKRHIVMETEHFIVVPSVGPLNESHLMIVPRQHILSFADCADSLEEEYETLLRKLAAYSDLRFKRKLIFFESGTGRFSGHAGGCIVHAHIHCVFESKRFEERLMREVDMISASRLKTAADTSHGYVWYRNGSGQSYICNRPLLPSQFLRYIYVESQDGFQNWNWRRDTRTEDVRRVLTHYAELHMQYTNGSSN